MDGREQFDAFVRERSPRLLRSAWLLTGGWTAAEDLVQQSLEQVLPKLAGLADIDHAEAYARRVMVRAFLRGRRRRWSQEIPTAPPTETSTVDPFDASDVRATILAGLARLPPRQRAVVVWRYFADLSGAQTAAAMGCSTGTVKTYTARRSRRCGPVTLIGRNHVLGTINNYDTLGLVNRLEPIRRGDHVRLRLFWVSACGRAARQGLYAGRFYLGPNLKAGTDNGLFVRLGRITAAMH